MFLRGIAPSRGTIALFHQPRLTGFPHMSEQTTLAAATITAALLARLPTEDGVPSLGDIAYHFQRAYLGVLEGQKKAIEELERRRPAQNQP